MTNHLLAVEDEPKEVRHAGTDANSGPLRVCILANWDVSNPTSTDVRSFFQFWPESQPQITQFGTSSSKLVNFVEKKFLRFHIAQLLRALPQLDQCDLLFCFSSQSGLPAAFWKALRHRRKPRLVVIDIENLPRLRIGPLKFFIDFAARQIDDLICFASFQLEGYRSVPALQSTRMTFIPFGHPQERLPRPANVPKNGSVVAVGYLGARFRDWPTLVEAYLRASNEGHISGPLIIVGRRLEPDLARRLGTRLVCHPYLSLERLAEVAAPSEMCVLPLPDRSLSLGQSTLVTLMALGKIVITADIGAVRDYVSDGQTGFLYRPGDARSLASAMGIVHQLSTDEATQIERAACHVARTEFEERTMIRRITEFLCSNSATDAAA
jgi:glycosyltransferase involved in cell wall biosynthesis